MSKKIVIKSPYIGNKIKNKGMTLLVAILTLGLVFFGTYLAYFQTINNTLIKADLLNLHWQSELYAQNCLGWITHLVQTTEGISYDTIIKNGNNKITFEYGDCVIESFKNSELGMYSAKVSARAHKGNLTSSVFKEFNNIY